MYAQETVQLERDCPAVLVPEGATVTLPAGSQVTITQRLGGDFTVFTSFGYLARIGREDADALGMEVEAAPEPETGPLTEERAWQEMRTIYDPEIPVNIVDLGLVYGCELAHLPEGGTRIDVRMTLTAPGCGMGQVLTTDVERRLRRLPGVSDVVVDVVFDPPWGPERMSEAARLELGIF